MDGTMGVFSKSGRMGRGLFFRFGRRDKGSFLGLDTGVGGCSHLDTAGQGVGGFSKISIFSGRLLFTFPSYSGISFSY